MHGAKQGWSSVLYMCKIGIILGCTLAASQNDKGNLTQVPTAHSDYGCQNGHRVDESPEV